MRYVLVLSLSLLFNCVWSQTLIWGERRSSAEIIVSDLRWKSAADMPRDLLNASVLKRWMAEFAAVPSQFAEIDIDGNEKTREVLIADGDFPGSGRAFLLVSQSSKSIWVELVGFRGAPIFTATNRLGQSMDLQVYSRRAGDMWISHFRRNRGRYVHIGERYVPRIFSTECSHRLWQQLNLMTYVQSEKCAIDS